jgi:prefoldin subunit 5
MATSVSKSTDLPYKRPTIITPEYKRIEDEIIRIKGEIEKLTPIVAQEKAVVDEDNRLIEKVYIPELEILIAQLKKVTDTHQSSYNSITARIAEMRANIASCNNPDADISFNPNKQKSLIRLAQIITDVSNIDQIYRDLSTVVDNIDASYEQYDADIITLLPQITGLKLNINKINGEIDDLEKAKEANEEKIYKINEEINNLNEHINNLFIKDYSNKVYNNENVLKLSETIDTSLNHLVSYLKNQALSSDVIYEKIEYRDSEHEILNTSNKAFDIIFYCFYFSFLLIMICTENIKREHFLIYLFFGLIPFIYPFIFKFVIYLINYTSTDPHGPKNAFVDVNNTIIAYNE